MHEFSVVQSILEITESEAKKHKATKIESVELDIGKLAGIEFSSFDFAWKCVTPDSILENSILKINEIPGLAVCLDCNKKYTTEQLFDACPNCSSVLKDIKSGKELIVKSITFK